MSQFNLTFSTLRTANALTREADDSGWPLYNFDGVTNIIKKLRYGEYALGDRPAEFEGATVREALGKELADVVGYADLLALQLGISLGDAVATRFNAVSECVGADVRIEAPFRDTKTPLGVFVQAVSVSQDDLAINAPIGEPPHPDDPSAWV